MRKSKILEVWRKEKVSEATMQQDCSKKIDKVLDFVVKERLQAVVGKQCTWCGG